VLDDLELYGYDARVPPAAGEPAWTSERRERFLLRPEVVQPLSVDQAVWPTVSAARPTDDYAPDYWASLSALQKACQSADLDECAASIVALTVAKPDDSAQALLIPAIPPAIDGRWQLLGYDVADSGLTSMLSNAAFDDATALRRRFGPAVNARGLFDSLGDAFDYRTIIGEHLPEHTPLHVHGILWIAGAR
jgi:hypothetical protein